MQISKEEFNAILLTAYHHGWTDCLAGDDVRSVDYQSDKQIIKNILTALRNRPTPKKLVDLLSRVIKMDAIEPWVRKPNKAFGGRRPIDVWFSVDRDQIEQMVLQWEAGVAT